MATPKIVELTSSCRTCSNKHGGECSLVGERIVNIDVVAPFCPLPDFPSKTIAGLELTVEGARDPHKWGLNYAVMNHVAAKLKLNLNSGRTSINIPYMRDGEKLEACLMFDCMVDMNGYAINFVDRDRKFKLRPDSTPPELSIESKELPEHWEPLTLLI